jgi:hypothetical protein
VIGDGNERGNGREDILFVFASQRCKRHPLPFGLVSWNRIRVPGLLVVKNPLLGTGEASLVTSMAIVAAVQEYCRNG